MRGKELLEMAKAHVVLFDGAMGTMLQACGLGPGECPELWNVVRPADVQSIHAAYVEAGSRVISTNTFGGNRVKLGAYGLEKRVHELNSAGVAIARGAAGDGNFVAASVGPTGKLLEPLGDLAFGEAVDVFAEQAFAQAEAGADVILIETFSDLAEARAALTGALRTGLPCFCTMAFDTGGRTMMGVEPVSAARELLAAGASCVGANCGVGPAEILAVARQIRQAVTDLVIVQPNAGIPRVVGGEVIYDGTPEDMAAYAVEYVRLGVNFIGTCCGSTPDHIRSIAARIERM